MLANDNEETASGEALIIVAVLVAIFVFLYCTAIPHRTAHKPVAAPAFTTESEWTCSVKRDRISCTPFHPATARKPRPAIQSFTPSENCCEEGVYES